MFGTGTTDVVFRSKARHEFEQFLLSLKVSYALVSRCWMLQQYSDLAHWSCFYFFMFVAVRRIQSTATVGTREAGTYFRMIPILEGLVCVSLRRVHGWYSCSTIVQVCYCISAFFVVWFKDNRHRFPTRVHAECDGFCAAGTGAQRRSESCAPIRVKVVVRERAMFEFSMVFGHGLILCIKNANWFHVSQSRVSIFTLLLVMKACVTVVLLASRVHSEV